MIATIDKETILKYDIPGPRYTSYPTAPEWSNSVNSSVYLEKLKTFGKTNKTLSLYIHIPFCQSMCYFCACNVVIRKHEDKYGDEYLEYLFKEIELVAKAIGRRMMVRQFHWGGGTPNFLSESQCERLFQKVQEHFEIDLNGEIAIEIDPRTIDLSKLRKLHSLGFNRVSMGVQDFDSEVQKGINRVQPFDMVKKLYGWCRDLKFHSVNYDLIYGLPRQTRNSFKETIENVISLKPDRIALYSFAYLPWMKKHQTKIDPVDLPSNDEKLEIFLLSRKLLLGSGYQPIAMDHFALRTDEMAKAFNEGTLYRNFMGYTVKPADEYIGLGVSAIGFLENTYLQNQKTLPEYYEVLERSELPIERGKVLNLDDQARQWVINQFMCLFKLDKREFAGKFQNDFDEYFSSECQHIARCIEDGLLIGKKDLLQATDLGKIFIRNICMGFDWYYRQQNAHRRFSKTV